MSPELINPLTVIASVVALLGLAFFIAALAALRRRRVFKLASRFTLAMLLLAVAGLFGTVAVATHGYQALTREEVAAVVRTEPVARQRFDAQVSFPDGRKVTFRLAGDQLYLDAHILKWKPIVNILGLHTAYELDRVAGRYGRVEEEQLSVRTVYALSATKPVDMFELRRRYVFLAPLLDAEYGSATFIPVDRPQTYEVRISTTGLLIRPIE